MYRYSKDCPPGPRSLLPTGTGAEPAFSLRLASSAAHLEGPQVPQYVWARLITTHRGGIWQTDVSIDSLTSMYPYRVQY